MKFSRLENTGVGSLSLLQGIFPTQRSNLGLLHCRYICYQLSHQGRPDILVALYETAARQAGTGGVEFWQYGRGCWSRGTRLRKCQEFGFWSTWILLGLVLLLFAFLFLTLWKGCSSNSFVNCWALHLVWDAADTLAPFPRPVKQSPWCSSCGDVVRIRSAQREKGLAIYIIITNLIINSNCVLKWTMTLKKDNRHLTNTF